MEYLYQYIAFLLPYRILEFAFSKQYVIADKTLKRLALDLQA
jgi:hypothetical protein